MLYDVGIGLFGLAVRFHGLLNAKSKAWVTGRKANRLTLTNWQRPENKKLVWFHCASLGEFEQALPVMQALKNEESQTIIAVSFFSPSGYEHRKNHPIADLVFYLQLDTRTNARRVIEKLKPNIVVVTKYDLWFHHLNEAKLAGAKLVLMAARFTTNQYFFAWYGAFGRKLLALFHSILVQEKGSQNLLNTINIENKICGDTRYDRVMAHTKEAELSENIRAFVKGKTVILGGSTWPEGEKMFQANTHFSRGTSHHSVLRGRSAVLILAPHDISENHILSIEKLFPTAIRYSKTKGEIGETDVLIIDNIGLLSSLYKVADVAYIGGAFGTGLHNILEATAFGVPVIFGPQVHGHPEASDMIKAGAAIQINNQQEFDVALEKWLAETGSELSASIIKEMQLRTGATKIVVSAIHGLMGITPKTDNTALGIKG